MAETTTDTQTETEPETEQEQHGLDCEACLGIGPCPEGNDDILDYI